MPRKYWLPALIVLLLVGAWALVGFVYVPRWVATGFRGYVADTLQLEPAIGEVRFNPFRLRLEVHGLAVRERGGDPLVATDRLVVDVSGSSLWHLEPVISAIELEHPVVAARLARDGTLNLAALAGPPKADEKPLNEPLPALELVRLDVRNAELGFEDLSVSPARHLRLAPVEFSLRDFSTRGTSRNAYRLQGTGPEGATVVVAGEFDPAPLRVDGRLQVGGFPLPSLANLAADALPVALPTGKLSLDVGFRGAQAAAGGFQLSLDLARIEVADAELRARGEPPASGAVAPVRLAKLLLEGGKVELATHQVSLGQVTVEGLAIDTRLDREGVALAKLFAGPAAPQPAAPKSTAPKAPAAKASATSATTNDEWIVAVPALHVSGSSVLFVDRTAPEPAPFELTAIDVKATDYSTRAGTTVPVALSATLGTAGHVGAQLKVQPDAPAVHGKVQVAGIDLKLLQPYLADRWRLDLQGGEAGVLGQVDVAPGKRASDPLRIAFDGDASVRALRTSDRLERKDFIRWQLLRLQGLKYRSDPAQLRVATLTLQQPYADLVIAANGTTNVSDVLASSAAAPSVFEAADDDVGEAGAAGAPANAAAPTAAAAASGSTPPATGDAAQPPAAGAGAMAMAIDTVRIEGGSANFHDYSIKPNFGTGLQELKGTVRGLSSEPGSRAALELEGAVDRYAPMKVSGEVNLLSAQSYLNLRASFRNMELTTLSPYSGKFAGYQIERGKLSVDVSYLVDNRKLDAKHKITLTQLQLGDKVDSPDATNLPLKLAVALLKDADGNIDLDIPVTGNLDDPKFRVGPIIWKMVRNLLRKVATAPFALLGKLFGGGEDMQYVDFAAGSPTIDAPMHERMQGLIKALKSRGGLSVEIPLGTDAGADGAALAERAWAAELESISPAATRADRAGHVKRLEQAWVKAFGKPYAPPPPPPPVAQPATATAAGAPAPAAMAPGAPAPPPTPEQLREQRIAALEAGLKARITVDAAALQALGRERANAIRDELLGSGEIDPIRVFIVAPAPAKVQAGQVRLSLSLRT